MFDIRQIIIDKRSFSAAEGTSNKSITDSEYYYVICADMHYQQTVSVVAVASVPTPKHQTSVGQNKTWLAQDTYQPEKSNQW